MATLVVWCNDTGLPNLYVIPDTETPEVYQAADGVCLNQDNTTSEQDTLIEHLAYMLGEEPYYNQQIPTLEVFKEEARQLYIESNIKTTEEREQSAFAPWSKYKVVSPVQLNQVRTIIRTGWL
jgi:hypothetical protein